MAKCLNCLYINKVSKTPVDTGLLCKCFEVRARSKFLEERGASQDAEAETEL